MNNFEKVSQLATNDVEIRVNLNDDEDTDVKCTFSKSGVCEIHKVRGTEIQIPVLRWKKNAKTGLFRNVSVKTKKFICKARKSVPIVPNICMSAQSQGLSGNNFLGESGTDRLSDGLPDNLQNENRIRKLD